MLWLIETRLHEHFDEVVERIAQPKDEVAFYRDMGRIVNYVQTVTSPAHAVPVFTGRWWRFSVSDRFNDYPVDADAVSEAVAQRCNALLARPDSYAGVLRETADATLTAIARPIDGLPATWEAFWRPDRRAGNFGDYGRAGNNFGARDPVSLWRVRTLCIARCGPAVRTVCPRASHRCGAGHHARDSTGTGGPLMNGIIGSIEGNG